MQQINSIFLSLSVYFMTHQGYILAGTGIFSVVWGFSLICGWKLFKKAGYAGWKSLIPVYGIVCEFRIIYGKGRYLLLCLIPVFGQIFAVYTVYKKARAFGRGKLFSVASILFGLITNAIMAFGKASYIGPQPLWGYKVNKEAAEALRRTYEKKYIYYDGYAEHLRIVCKNGVYFRFYKLRDNAFREESIRRLLSDREMVYQVLCNRRGSYILAGQRAEDAGRAAEKLAAFELENSQMLISQTCEDWFEFMSERLRFEPFAGFPEMVTTKKGKIKKKNRKETSIEKLQPWNVKKLQTKMEISGKETQTIIFVNFPSSMFEAFGTELMRLSDSITISVFAEIIDKEKCLEGMEKLTDMRPARRRSMKAFLEKHIKNGTDLYNTGIMVNITGSPVGIQETYERVVRYCRKYLIAVNQLDYQQSDGFISTLPMLDNRIRYHRVMDLVNLQAFLPWSRLHDTERTVYYGKNAFEEEIWYDRIGNRESGFVLANDYQWCVSNLEKEIGYQVMTKPGIRSEIQYAAAKPAGSAGRTFTLDITDRETSNMEILSAAVKHWLLDALSVGGRAANKDINTVCMAVEKAMEEVPEDLTGFTERVISQLSEQQHEKLKGKSFKTEYTYISEAVMNGIRKSITDTGAYAEIAYTLLMHSIKEGMVVSLDTELLDMPHGSGFKVSSDVIYTFLSPDIRRLYGSRIFESLAETSTYYYIGEHHISDKLHLSGVVGLTKEQRNVISAPARADVLIAELCEFIIPVDKEEVSMEEREAV